MTDSMITNVGLKLALNRSYKSSPDYTASSRFKVGSGSTDPVGGNTDLETPVPIQNTEAVDSCDATTGWTVTGSGGISVNTTTYKEGTGSLNIVKSGTGASATVYIDKATTSRDFTSKELSLWCYIKDSTMLAKLDTGTGVEIRLGSGTGTYYGWVKGQSDLSTGWNLIDGLTSSNQTAGSGSPTIAACDYTYVGISGTGSTVTWGTGDVIIDDIKVISSGDYYKNFETDYPTLDETNMEATIRCKVPSTMCNGYSLTEFGIFNTDTTDILQSRDTFTTISKTNTDEILFITVDKIRRG